jgi:hypothetical protein
MRVRATHGPTFLMCSRGDLVHLQCSQRNTNSFGTFGNAAPLFSSTFELFKTPGWGVPNASEMRCAQKDENII